jgi:hypothetical protein
MTTQAEKDYQNQEKSLNNLNLYLLDYDVKVGDNHYQYCTIHVEALNWNWAVNHISRDVNIENLTVKLLEKNYKVGVSYGSRTINNIVFFDKNHPEEISVNGCSYGIEHRTKTSKINSKKIYDIFRVHIENGFYDASTMEYLIKDIESDSRLGDN